MIAIIAPSPSPTASTATQVPTSGPLNGIINDEEEAAVALSRNTSVISTNSSSSSSSSVGPPPRPRPIRTYTGPQAKNVPDVLPASPTTPKATQRTFDDYLLAGAAGASTSRTSTPTADSNGATGGGIEAQMAQAIVMGSASLHVPSSAANSIISSGFNTPTRGSPTPGISTPNGARSRQPSGSNNAQNYRFEGVLGEGSYSTVFTATSLLNQQVYAVKVISKRLLQKENKVRYANSERSILSKLGAANHPGVIRLFSAFQDANSLYFAMELAPNGELFTHLRRLGSFNISGTRYYSATILDAVSFIHSMNIIHRDLKPENILLDANMRIKISDFGTAKDKAMLPPDDNVNAMKRKGSFVGTPEYASPEMLVPPTITTRASDIWAYGCIVFQFISGRPPFKEGTDYLTMKKIQEGKYEFPEGFDEVVKTLVERCLVIDPLARITGENLHKHPFFESIVWETLWKETPPLLESGLVKPPENLSQALSLNWSDIEGSEEEMEDLQPRLEEQTEQMAVQIPSAGDPLEVGIRHRRSTSGDAGTGTERAPTRLHDASQLYSMSPSSPSEYMSKLRRFSQSSDTTRRRMSPSSDGAGRQQPVTLNDGRRLSAGADSEGRPRRISPSSLDGRPSLGMPSHAHSLDEEDEGNVIEDDSVQGSTESPPSTVEDAGTTASDLVAGTSLSTSLVISGHTKTSSAHSSADMTLMSTSGTSGASGTSTGAYPGTARVVKGFEMVRGARGVQLATDTPQNDLKDVTWTLTNGQILPSPSEKCVHVTPVTTRVKRGILPSKQRRRLLILTSTGRLVCIKELKPTTGKRTAQLVDEMVLPVNPSRSQSIVIDEDKTPDGTKLYASNAEVTVLPVPTSAINGGAQGTSSSNPPSKRSSILSLSSGSAITSALPNLSLTLPGSSKSPSAPKNNVNGAETSRGDTSVPAVSKPVKIVAKVESKGDSGFILTIGTRMVVYTVDSHDTMTEWVGKIKAAMESR